LSREVCLDPRLLYNFTAPRFGVEVPLKKDADYSVHWAKN
jgi:hypothetical protein